MARRRNPIRSPIVLALLIAGLAVSLVLTLSIGSSVLPFHTVYRILRDKLFGGAQALDAGMEAGLYTMANFQVVWNIRMPRVLFGMLCGAGLSVCGAAMQALVLNPIADPYILGISSGASAGAAAALLLPLPIIAGSNQVVLFAMLGAMISSAAVYTMARVGSGGQIRPVTLLLSGTAVNAVMSAATSLLVFLAKSPESIAAVYNWQMGSIAAAQWSTLWFPMVGVATGVVVFSCCGNRFNQMMMGDEDATSMGLNVRRFRTLMFVVSSLVVASLVSVTGIIGFVGLVVPHIVRLLAGTSDNKTVIPFSAVLGAIYLIWADSAARGLFGGAELPLGIITAFVGAPFFMYLMARRKYGGQAQ
ncbi:MAG: iron ABC transporter permease [Clostridia bacterium]|nr:iron ABC transporter permease [Clostridia bacterium]